MASKPPCAGARFDSTGAHYWVDGRTVTREEYAEHLRWLAPDFLFRQMMKEQQRCSNCLLRECFCCRGCGQPNADIIGSHGYHCTL